MTPEIIGYGLGHTIKNGTMFLTINECTVDNPEYRRITVMDRHDVKKLSTLRDSGRIPKLSNDKILNVMRNTGRVRPTRNGESPTLDCIVMMGQALIPMLTKANIDPHIISLEMGLIHKMAGLYRVGGEYSADVSHRLFSTEELEAYHKLGVFDQNGYPTRVLQELLTNEKLEDLEKSLRPSLGHTGRFSTAMETTLIPHGQEFWTTYGPYLASLPVDGETEYIPNCDKDFLKHLDRLSDDGVVLIKGGKYLYKSRITDTCVKNATSHSSFLIFK